MFAGHAQSAPTSRVDRNGTAIVVRDQRLADYVARLGQEHLAMPVPAGPRPSALCYTGHGHVAHPGADGISDPRVVGEGASAWACHQKCGHKLSAYTRQKSDYGHYPGEDTAPLA